MSGRNRRLGFGPLLLGLALASGAVSGAAFAAPRGRKARRAPTSKVKAPPRWAVQPAFAPGVWSAAKDLQGVYATFPVRQGQVTNWIFLGGGKGVVTRWRRGGNGIKSTPLGWTGVGQEMWVVIQADPGPYVAQQRAVSVVTPKGISLHTEVRLERTGERPIILRSFPIGRGPRLQGSYCREVFLSSVGSESAISKAATLTFAPGGVVRYQAVASATFTPQPSLNPNLKRLSGITAATVTDHGTYVIVPGRSVSMIAISLVKGGLLTGVLPSVGNGLVRRLTLNGDDYIKFRCGR